MEKTQKELMALCVLSLAVSIVFFAVSLEAPNVFGKCETCPSGMLGTYAFAFFIGAVFLAIIAVAYPNAKNFFGNRFSEGNFLLWLSMTAISAVYFFAMSKDLYFDDSFSHFLNAKYSWIHPELFFNFWHKPVFNFIISFPAQLGIYHVAFLNVAISIAAVFIVYLTARELKMERSYFAVILCAFAPIFFLSSNSVLTEPMFALFLASAFYFLAKKDFVKSSFFVSLLPFVRTEGIFMIAIWVFILWKEKRLSLVPILLAVPVLVTIMASIAKGDLLWIIHDNVYIGHSFYGTGPVTNFFEKFFLVSGAATMLFFQLGLAKKTRDWALFAIKWSFISYFLFYVMAFSVGGMAAASEVREMAAIAPAIAILALAGLNDVFRLIRENIGKDELKRHLLFGVLFVAEIIFLIFFVEDFMDKLFTIMFAGTVFIYSSLVLFRKFAGKIAIPESVAIGTKALLIMLVVLGGILFVHPPRELNTERQALFETADWINENGLGRRPLLASHAVMHVAANNDPFTNYPYYHWAFENLGSAEKGTILVWDKHYSKRYAKMEKTDLAAHGYESLKAIEFKGNTVEVFEKTS